MDWTPIETPGRTGILRIDISCPNMENGSMETQTVDLLEEVLKHLHTGGVKDPELLRRIREQSAAVQEEIFRKHGLLDIAVNLIRETRDE